ncbi:MAG TPA: tetratricopeptide repeat protein [Planctomycetota bacterium]|nr:tetratricopeptide repeat protein [Planctomycetota bacterium]
MTNAWVRRLLLFAAGVGLFLLVKSAWGDEGVRTGRIAAIAVLALVFAGLVVVAVAARRRRGGGGVASDIARLLRAGQVDEAVRKGRELFGKTPADPHVAWYYTAALMKSGHLAEARRVFAGLRADALPPKMAAMYAEVKRALDGANAG